VGIQVNGHNVAWSVVVSAVMLISWLSGLSYRTVANAEDLAKLENVPADIAVLKASAATTNAAVMAIARALNVEVVATTAPLSDATDSEDEDGG